MNVTSKALDQKAELMVELIYDTVLKADFSDKERIKQLVTNHASELETSLKMMAIEYVQLAAQASQSYENSLRNKWEGLEYCDAIMAISKNIDSELDGLILKMQHLQQLLAPNEALHLVLACDQTVVDTISSKNNIQKISYDSTAWQTLPPLQEPLSYGYPISSFVAFNARGFRTVRYNPYLLLAAELVTSKVLMPRVRLEGGAYGSFARYEPASGDFTLLSYRDPNITSTDAIFQSAIELLASGAFTEEDIQNAKIATIRKLDRPLHPSTKAFVGYEHYLEGRSVEERKEFRQKLLAATQSDIQQAVSNHIAPNFAKSKLVTLASKELIQKNGL